MTRDEFEALLSSPGKRIIEPIELVPDPSQPLKLVAQGRIRNDDGIEAVMYVRFDTRTFSKTINVVVNGVGQFAAWMLMGRGIEPRVVITSMIFKRNSAQTATSRKRLPGQNYRGTRSKRYSMLSAGTLEY
jgi:hypothetical protein